MDASDDSIIFSVVVNQLAQYSIWPSDRVVPAGWQRTGKDGKRSECLVHIEEVWTDMTPSSLRQGSVAAAP